MLGIWDLRKWPPIILVEYFKNEVHDTFRRGGFLTRFMRIITPELDKLQIPLQKHMNRNKTGSIQYPLALFADYFLLSDFVW